MLGLGIGLIALWMNSSALAASAATYPTTKAARDPLSDLPSYGEAVKRMVYTLMAIVAVLILVARFLPRLLGKRPLLASGKLIQMIESHRLEPRKILYVVRVGEQYFLLGSTGDRIEVLSGGPLDHQRVAELLKSEQAAASAKSSSSAPARSFADVLLGKRRSDKSS